MKIVGIVAEYNPFHNGHKYHIAKIKEMFEDSLIILVLNGYFSERGEISVLTKADKTKIALENNVDLVIELPFVYGTQAADIFAYNSIKLLNNLKVDYLIFGSESNNIEKLEMIADIQLNDPNYEQRVKEYLDQGVNYPTAMAKALNLEEDINQPNDLLGISYVKAIKKLNSSIKPLTILRTNGYHDLENSTNIVSASNIRVRLENQQDISNLVPSNVLSKILKIDEDRIFTLLKFKILTDKDLSIYLDVDEGIEYRILKFINKVNNLEELRQCIKSKRYTYNKINRMFIHILIGLTKEDNKNIQMDYIKILGFNNKGKEYLSKIKKDLVLPTKPNKETIVYKYELLASYIYEQITKVNVYEFDKDNKPISN